jgi:hypothetical protein
VGDLQDGKVSWWVPRGAVFGYGRQEAAAAGARSPGALRRGGGDGEGRVVPGERRLVVYDRRFTHAGWWHHSSVRHAEVMCATGPARQLFMERIKKAPPLSCCD